jgi:hypothetical protein
MTGFLLVILYFAMAAVAAVIIMQPDRFVVTRAAVIDAPPERVFGHINDLRKWEAWSPWARLDPAAQNSFEGPAAGPGAAFEWAGDRKVGAGRMTIVGSRPFESVDIKLEAHPGFRGDENGRRGVEGGRCVEMTRRGALSRSAID